MQMFRMDGKFYRVRATCNFCHRSCYSSCDLCGWLKFSSPDAICTWGKDNIYVEQKVFLALFNINRLDKNSVL